MTTTWYWPICDTPPMTAMMRPSTWVLGAFAAVCAAWFVAGVADSPVMLQALAAPAGLLGLATAGYTAFLFGQCEGRDLWQTPLLLPTLLAQAAVAGGAAYSVADLVMDVPEVDAVRWVLLGGLLVTGVLVAAEIVSRGTAHVEAAVEAMTRGRYARRFWAGGVALGLVVPAVAAAVALAAGTGAALPAIAGLCALAGMWFYEDSFVRAGQSVPLS